MSAKVRNKADDASASKRRPSLQQELTLFGKLRISYNAYVYEPLHSVRDAIVEKFGPGVFFGFLDHRRKSFRSSISECLLYVFYRLSQIGLVLLIYYAVKEWQFMVSWVDNIDKLYKDVEMDWWDWVATVQLFIGIFLPAYQNTRKERRYFQEEGSFSQRVVVSLNCLIDVPARDEKGKLIPGAKPVKVFYMRTLLEEDMTKFIPDYAWRTLLLDQVEACAQETEKKQKVFKAMTSEEQQMFPLHIDPFVESPPSRANETAKFNDHVRNNLSMMCKYGHLVRDAGLPFVEHRYHWGVAAEKSGRKSVINDKLRIYLVRDTTLNTIGAMIERGEQPDWNETKRYNAIPDVALGYFKKRFKNLGILYGLCERLANDDAWKAQSNLFISTVGMAFPAPSFEVSKYIAEESSSDIQQQEHDVMSTSDTVVNSSVN